MRARIGSGENQVEWSIEESINPSLIIAVRNALLANKNEWKNSVVEKIAQSLIKHYSYSELKEMVYDEDPNLIAEIAVLFKLKQEGNILDNESDENYRNLSRLYMPVIFSLVQIFLQKMTI